MRKLKNGILEGLVCLMIFASFKMPEVLLQKQNDKIQATFYKAEKPKATMDVEVQEIYLVKAIHQIETTSKVAILAQEKVKLESLNEENRLEKELQKLKEAHILQDFSLGNKEFIWEREIYQTENKIYQTEEEVYQTEKEECYLHSIFFQMDGQEVMAKIEEKTGRVLELVIARKSFADTSKEEILRQYVQYLDLYIIDDWKFENNCLQSEKAQLAASLITSENSQIPYAILAIHALPNKFELVEYLQK